MDIYIVCVLCTWLILKMTYDGEGKIIDNVLILVCCVTPIINAVFLFGLIVACIYTFIKSYLN